MKIGIVLSSSPGYSETFFTSKIKGLQSNGIEVILFVQSKSKGFNLCKVVKTPKVFKNYPLVQMGMFLWVFISLIPFLPNVIRYCKLERKQKTSISQLLKNIYLNSSLLKQQLDWLHFGFATQAIGSELVAKAIGAKMAVSFRGFDIAVYPKKHPDCYKNLWKHIDKVHSISNYLLKEAYVLGLSKNTSFQIITPAVNLDVVNFYKSRDEINTTIQIVTVARLHYIKGIDILIETALLLKQKSLKFTWNVIGDGTKNYLERYQYHIYEKGLQNEVSLKGKLTHADTLSLVQTTDLYVQPSLNEGFCNAVLEAQAMGKLCIVSDVGGLPENVIHHKTGWLVPQTSPEFFAKQIEESLALPKTRKAEIAKNAMERVEKEFNIEKQQKEFVEFYTK